ncbi:Aldehyde dehydrogenase 2 member B4, mitochondrial [Blyttiomyces sp. JEL0837]|nr:Aldehyde dehydrogenase 2 member B4, mitochondrial [Blyttiomyces sp. JEL0837]
MKSETKELSALEASTGRPITEAKADVEACVDYLRFFAGHADKLHGRAFATLEDRFSYTLREPYGVCVLAVWKLAPALAAGNTCIVKPAPQTPFSTLKLAEIAYAKTNIPPGVLNVLIGGAEVGSEIVSHAGVDKVSFTGSTKAGVAVSKLLSEKKGGPSKGTMELGGKNAIIVCDDADLELAVEHIADGAFSRVGRIKVGPSTNEDTNMGPLVDEVAFKRVMAAIGEAQREGGLLFCGGKSLPSNGFFIEPTIKDDSLIATAEIFGPVLAILEPFDRLDDALERVNRSPLGLAGGIFSSNQKNIQRAVKKLHVGFVWVNCYNDTPPYLPLGGVKSSGYGKDCGFEALDEFTIVKSVYCRSL